MEHIRKCLPDLKNRVNDMTVRFQKVIASCGEPVVNKHKTLLDIINKFSTAYTSAIDGNSKELETNEV